MATFTLAEAQQLAWQLQRFDSRPVAILGRGSKAYFARHEPSSPEPASAVTRLIQGVYEREGTQARFTLRARIFATAAPRALCWSMMKVAARRLTAPIEPIDHGLSLAHQLIEVTGLETAGLAAQKGPSDETGFPLTIWRGAGVPRSEAELMALVSDLASLARRESAAFYERDRAIAALALSPEGALLSWGLNSSRDNRTLHAELNLVQRYWRAHQKKLPPHTRVYVSRKPCRMCAALLFEATKDAPTLRVIYADDDPGPNARETVFNAPGLTIERRYQS